MKKILSISLFTAVVLLCGCGGSGSNTNTGANIAALEVEGKSFLFYNETTGEQYLIDTDANTLTSLDTNTSSPLSRKDKESGALFYWPWLSSEGELSGEKVLMFTSSYNYATDGNISYEDFFYLGDVTAHPPHAHAASEFDPNNPNLDAATKASKAAVVKNLNDYLSRQNEIRTELAEALANEGEELCSFYLPPHAHTEDENESIPHYVLSKSGKIYVFTEQDGALTKLISSSLTGATSCEASKNGITQSSEHGVYIFLEQTQTLYLYDAHELSDATMTNYHEHSRWNLSEFMPSGVSASQMVGFGEGEEGHDH